MAKGSPKSFQAAFFVCGNNGKVCFQAAFSVFKAA
jgi:hypothetical protein